jgi:superfamily II RNA helicase
VVCKVLFGEENVGLLIGDTIINREALILIMTIDFFLQHALSKV